MQIGKSVRRNYVHWHFVQWVRAPFVAAFLFLLSPYSVWSQGSAIERAASGREEFTGKVVESVSFEPAYQRIDSRDLARMQLVQVGQPLEPRQVAATLDRLFSTGLYDDLKVDARPRGNGVAIVFLTKQRRFIGHVDAQGDISSPPSRAVILSDSELSLGNPFDEEALETAKKNIEAELRRNGLYRGRVDVTTIEDPETRLMTIRFLIASGDRARYEAPVIDGTPKLSDSTILRATGWRIPIIHRWRQVTQALTDKGIDGIQKKYADKDRLTTSVDLKSLDYNSDTNRLKPALNIQAGPQIEVKALEAKVSKSKLRKYIPIYQEGSVDRDLLTEGARNLHDYFQSKGYPDVDVTFNSEPVKDDHQVINYYISTGPRRKLVNIDIDGNTYFLRETLEERMFLKTKTLLMRYGRYSESFRHQDENAIENLYQSNGFRDVKVTSAVETNYKGKESDLSVRFNVNPGPQWTVGKLEIEGPVRHSLNSLIPQLASAEGQPYADVNIATDRNLILQDYYSDGFPNTGFRFTTEPGSQPHTVNLTYEIREGPQQFVNQVIVSGLYRTRPSLIQRRLTIQPGEPISMVKINDINREMSNLGIFANVASAVQDSEGNTIYKNVLYDFDEAARYSFNVGFGLQVGVFGTPTNNVSNSGGSSGVSPIVAFDVNRLNFLGRGQTIGLQTRYSSIEQRYALNYIIPRFLGSFDRTVTFSLLYNLTRDVQTFSSRRAEASVATSQRLNRASTLVVRFAYRRVSTGNIVIPSLLIPSLLQPVRIGILSASYIQDHRDNPADAHHGFWNTIDTGIAGGFFGSQREFYRVLARNATYTQLTKNLVLARQTQFGAVVPFNIPQGTSRFEDIPLPERFFGGGGVSMRGFGYNQAGPRDIGTPNQLPGIPTTTPTGFPVGGNGLFFNNIELRFPLLGPNINGVFFHDLGNIYSNVSDISFRYRQPSNQNFNYAVQAAGFGIRYKTPVGPVRVDLAYNLNPTSYQGFNRNENFQDLLRCRPAGTPGVSPEFIIGTGNRCSSSPQTLSHFQFFFSIGQAF